MTMTSTGAFASVLAAHNPPKPAPMITTRGGGVFGAEPRLGIGHVRLHAALPERPDLILVRGEVVLEIELMGELIRNSRSLNLLLDEFERNPNAIIFGKPTPRPGPGETGFTE